jgi:hypothetical protein
MSKKIGSQIFHWEKNEKLPPEGEVWKELKRLKK